MGVKNKDISLDPRVEAYVTGRLSDDDEAQFCNDLMDSPELQRQVNEAAMLRDGIQASARPKWSLSWPVAAAAGVVGLVAGAAIFGARESVIRPVVTGPPVTLAGTVRGENVELPIYDATAGLTLLIPTGRCEKLNKLSVTGPDISLQPRVPSHVSTGISVGLPPLPAGDYRLELHFSDCPSDNRSFRIK